MIILYFGSFSPVHKGHTMIARKALASVEASELWFVVSPENPDKMEREKGILASFEDRVRMVELAIRGEERERPAIENFLKVSLVERDNVPSYTYLTIEKLEREYPKERFAILLGEDNFKELRRWKNIDSYFDKILWIVYPRGFEGSLETLTLSKNVLFLDMELLDISSTIIRETLYEKGFDGKWLDGEVESYIKNRGLFR